MKKIALFILCLLAIQSVVAIGISPAKSYMTEPGTFTFRPIHNGPVSVRVEGSLAELIQLDSTLTGQGELVTGTLSQWPDLPPGEHAQRIIISPTEFGDSGTVSVKAEVAALLIIQVPYDGPYLEGTFSVSHDADTTLATLMLENVGNEPVVPDAIGMEISDANIGASFSFTPKGIASLSTEKFQERQQLGLPPGSYSAYLRVPYKDTVFEKTGPVTIGSPTITIDKVTYHGDERGAIKPIDISGRIGWNTPLELSVTVTVDEETVYETEVMANPTYDSRMYIEVQPEHSLFVEVSTGGVTTSHVVNIEESEEEKKSRTWPWILASLLLIIIWVTWRILSSRQKKDIYRGNSEK